MSISISSSNAATLSASQTTLASSALRQSPVDATTPISPLTVTVTDPRVAAARLAKGLQAIGAPLSMGADAQNAANALMPTMESIVSERPDLANAHFDFRSSNGSIQVVSDTLSTRDKNWIQEKLNANSNLVQAVKSFHDHAVSGYAAMSEAGGSPPLTQAQLDAVSKEADGLFSFLNLFQRMGDAAQKYQMTDGTYKTSDGTTMNLAQDPTTAAGFLEFNKSAQAAANGTFSFISNSGPRHNSYGSPLNIFLNHSLMHFYPPETKSLGLNEVA
jgi:hypothetical protein